MNSQPIQTPEVELDLGRYELRRAGRSIRLEKQPMELLILLVEKQGQLVGRDEIVARLWGQQAFVDSERSINTAIRKIRLALRDDPDQPRFVQTVVGKGYRFISTITVIPRQAPSVPASPVPPIASEPPEEPRAPPPVRRFSRQWIALSGATVLLLLSFGIWWQRYEKAKVSRSIQSIAVLPLENLSGDPSQEYFADGMTDELITDLAGIHSIRVISRTSVMQYKGKHEQLPKIAKELNVDAVVEGSVVRSGGRVRITAQLIQAHTDRHLWAHSYEGDLRDVLELQREVARNIAGEIRTALATDARTALQKSGPINMEAYDTYLKGRYYWNSRTPEGLQKSLQFFEQAIGQDPRSALAYAGRADAYNMFANYFLLRPQEAFPQAEAAARRALELDDSLAEAHTALAFAKFHYDWDWSGAEREFHAAIALNPSYATAHQWYAEFLTASGRFDEAIAEIRYAQVLDPLSLIIQSNVGRLLYFARRDDQSISELRTTIELHPQQAYAHMHLGFAYEDKRMYPQAIAELKTAASLWGRRYSVGLAHLYAVSGEPAKAVQILKELEGPAGGNDDPFFFAGIYAALGNRDKAFATLERAYREHSFFISFIKVFPWMDPLRQDPRFADLLSRMGLTKS